MPRTASIIPAGAEISDRLSLAQVTRFLPLHVVRQTLEAADKQTKRQRELPNELMAYFPVLLSLYRNRSQKEVLRTLADGLHYLFGLTEFKITGRSGISQARSRVGAEPLSELVERCAIPLAKPDTIGAFYKDLRLVAVDGSSLDLEDNEVNEEYFGRPSTKQGGPRPLARLSGLVEVGTRAFFAIEVAPWKSSSELSLALNVVKKLKPEMLCLGDRYYAKFPIIKEVMETGAHFLFRRQENWKLEREEVLPDGSFLSTAYSGIGETKGEGVRVRVLEFDAVVEMNGSKTPTKYTLVTDLFDYRLYPYMELANLYRERWEFETALDEMKTHLMAGQPLRSKTPELVIQEIYGMVLAHYVIRAVMYEAASSEKLDPDRLSFEHTKNVLKRHVPAIGAFPPSTDCGNDQTGSALGESVFQ